MRTDRGFSLVEVLLALALAGMATVGFFQAILYTDRIAHGGYVHMQARLYVGECLEVARSIRDADGFDALADGTYGLDASSGQWQFVPAPDVHDTYIRQVAIEPYDTDTKLLTCAVSWDDFGSQSMSVTTLLAR